MKTVKLELTMTELFRVEMALIEYRVDIERDIANYTEQLNGSDNTTEVKLYNDLLTINFIILGFYMAYFTGRVLTTLIFGI